MIGDGPEDFVLELKAAAAKGAARDRIHWLGLRNDVVALLGTCAVSVCPSRYEPLGRVIFEAWDAGAVPVACATSGGTAEIITAADGGILYAEETAESLATALQAALHLPAPETKKLIDNGRSWMAVHCDPAVHAATIGKILREASIPSR
jgi:glycosyltransferase involved in cell wall biosynthesis